MVGRHQQDGPRGKSGDQVGDEAVDRDELGVVVVPEAVSVGDLVDAVVVGVDERLAGLQPVPDLDRKRRRDPVVEEGGGAEVCGGEAGAGEVDLRHDGHGPCGSGKGHKRLERGDLDGPAGVVVGTEGPPQHVHDLIAVGQTVPEDAVIGRGPPGGDRGEGGGRGRRCDRGDGPIDTGRGREGRGESGPLAELRPSESVDHQEDDLASVSHLLGHPVVPRVGATKSAEDSWDDVGDARALVVREDRQRHRRPGVESLHGHDLRL